MCSKAKVIESFDSESSSLTINDMAVEQVASATSLGVYIDHNEVWGNCNQGLSERLQKLQNRAARIFNV